MSGRFPFSRPRQAGAWRSLALVLLAGCVSSQAGALNRDVADYNQRLLAFQRDYQAAMTDLQYLRRAPGFNSLLVKGVDEGGGAHVPVPR